MTFNSINLEFSFVDSGQLADFKLFDNENIKRHVTITNEAQLATTKVLLQLGLDERTIISSAYPSFSFGGRNSAGH
jgi:hypothetical protein